MLRDFPYSVNPRLAFLHNYVVIQLDVCWFRPRVGAWKGLFRAFCGLSDRGIKPFWGVSSRASPGRRSHTRRLTKAPARAATAHPTKASCDQPRNLGALGGELRRPVRHRVGAERLVVVPEKAAHGLKAWRCARRPPPESAPSRSACPSRRSAPPARCRWDRRRV